MATARKRTPSANARKDGPSPYVAPDNEAETLEVQAGEETGPNDAPVSRIARGYLHAKHPDHGEAVVFVPGELLPQWAWELQENGGS